MTTNKETRILILQGNCILSYPCDDKYKYIYIEIFNKSFQNRYKSSHSIQADGKRPNKHTQRQIPVNNSVQDKALRNLKSESKSFMRENNRETRTNNNEKITRKFSGPLGVYDQKENGPVWHGFLEG